MPPTVIGTNVQPMVTVSYTTLNNMIVIAAIENSVWAQNFDFLKVAGLVRITGFGVRFTDA